MQQPSVALPVKQATSTTQIVTVDAATDLQQTRTVLQNMNLEELAILRRAIQRELFLLTYFPKIVYGLLLCSFVFAMVYVQM